MNGKYGNEALLRHHPDNILTSFFFVIFRNSLMSLVFPLPASPDINTVDPLPLHAKSNIIPNLASSCCLPANAGSDSL
jgi:hypothetical protein